MVRPTSCAWDVCVGDARARTDDSSSRARLLRAGHDSSSRSPLRRRARAIFERAHHRPCASATSARTRNTLHARRVRTRPSRDAGKTRVVCDCVDRTFPRRLPLRPRPRVVFARHPRAQTPPPRRIFPPRAPSRSQPRARPPSFSFQHRAHRTTARWGMDLHNAQHSSSSPSSAAALIRRALRLVHFASNAPV